MKGLSIVFDIEFQYQEYLRRVKLKESEMHPFQRIETKRAFMGAWGQLIALMSNEIPVLPEKDAITVLETMTVQVSDFWLKQK
jgi:hypothetical protein